MSLIGDIAFRILDEMKESSMSNDSHNEHGHVTVCDINKSMLEVGKDRAKKVNALYIQWKTILSIFSGYALRLKYILFDIKT